ncbi:MAG TPA: hypothetical protein VF266_27975, partial [Thermoanaerobaculia bacterium]
MSVEPPREVHPQAVVSPIRPVADTGGGTPPRGRKPRKSTSRRSTKRWKWFREFGLPLITAIAAPLVLTTGGYLYSQLAALKDLPRWRTEVESWRKTADGRQQQLETWQREARQQTQMIAELKTQTKDAETRLHNLHTEMVEVRTRVEDLRDMLRPSVRRSATLKLPPMRDVSMILAAAPGVIVPSAAPPPP